MSDPTDRGVSMRAKSPGGLPNRKAWLAMLTKLVEAFPPQMGTDTALGSRLTTYLDALADRWHPDTGAKAIKAGLLEWKFFPSIAEIETQCRRFEPKSFLVDSGRRKHSRHHRTGRSGCSFSRSRKPSRREP